MASDLNLQTCSATAPDFITLLYCHNGKIQRLANVHIDLKSYQVERSNCGLAFGRCRTS
jgi:hypothetical protein